MGEGQMGGYMVCDKCEKHFMLQPGALPADFKDKCSCGGNFKFRMRLNNLEEYDTSPRKYVVNKYVKMGEEDKQLLAEKRKIKFDLKNNFEWFHVLFLILVLLSVIVSTIAIIIH
jgi:hypothetical protein